MGESDVVIVGAGAGGLSAAAELRRVGVQALVLERADDVGASWASRYDRLRLNTCRWTSTLPHSRYPRGTAMFPSRDEMVRYLKEYAERNGLSIRFGTKVESISPSDGRWSVMATDGEHLARQVVVATGYEHTPQIPEWPGKDGYAGKLIHAGQYRNADDFQGVDVLVVGPGCSGMEIAYDLAQGGAGRVWIAVRTQPNILLRQSGGLPGDLPGRAMLRMPARIGDRMAGTARRLTIGDLSRWGLVPPEEGVISRLYRDGKAPAIVDKEVIAAIKSGRLEVVAALAGLEGTTAVLVDGRRLEPGAVIAATGYGTGLEPIVGQLGVLDERGVPRVHGGPPAAPGLRFIGYRPDPGQIGDMGREARRAAREIKSELGVEQPSALVAG